MFGANGLFAGAPDSPQSGGPVQARSTALHGLQHRAHCGNCARQFDMRIADMD